MTIFNKWSKFQNDLINILGDMATRILKSYPNEIRLFYIEMREKNVIPIPIGYDFKMPYLLEYLLDRCEIWNTYLIWSLNHV